jgi:hypothetical protein
MKASTKVSDKVAPTTKPTTKKVVTKSNDKTAKTVPTDKVKVKTGTGTKEKSTTLKKSEVDSKNIKDTVKQAVVSQREIKYKYPEDIINDPAKKKTFRQVARNKMKNLENDLAKVANRDSKEWRIANRKLKAYKTEVLMVPEA